MAQQESEYARLMRQMNDADDRERKESAGSIQVADLAGIVRGATGESLSYQNPWVHVEVEGQGPLQMVLDGDPQAYAVLIFKPGTPQDAAAYMMHLHEFHRQYPDVYPAEIYVEGFVQGKEFAPETNYRVVGRDAQTLTREYRKFAQENLSNGSGFVSRLLKRSRPIRHFI